MSASKNQISKAIERLNKNDRLSVLKNSPIPNSNIKASLDFTTTENGLKNRRKQAGELKILNALDEFTPTDQFKGNIENFIGFSAVPTGVIGPLKVTGSKAEGDYIVPLATTEGALVASYNRGASACYLAGGISSICLREGVQRAPVFKFETLLQSCEFVIWIETQFQTFTEITLQQTAHGKLEDIKAHVEANQVTLTFEYYTGDAAGQNMVTFCTSAICQYIIEKAPVQPERWYLEGNFSGDKKANANSFLGVRGKKVSAEVVLSEEIVKTVLKSTPKKIYEYWKTSTVGVIQTGAIGAQGHYANGLAALFIATGQDVACVAEAATGITRLELQDDGSLYAAVTLPNLIVGTVGGGTGLPSQKECLEIMDCYGAGNAVKFAEITAAVLLCGELSIAAALSAHHFSQAHQQLGRK
jgi:hydroxymethylglutaryl-CoA reductase (NADPH)